MELTDSHCHLQDPRLAPELDGVFARAREAGVRRIVCCATSEADWADVLAVARTRPGVVPMLGLHPWHVDQASPGWTEALEAALTASGAGVGECGLDFVRAEEASARAHQETALRLQLRLARRLDRPVALHCREAWGRLLALLEEEGAPQGLVHAFSGSPETARALQALGLHLSFGCGLARPGATRTTRAFLATAPERRLLETDAPDLGPRHLEAWTAPPNEPAALRVALARAASLCEETEEALAAQVQANAARLFGALPGWA